MTDFVAARINFDDSPAAAPGAAGPGRHAWSSAVEGQDFPNLSVIVSGACNETMVWVARIPSGW